MTYINSIFFELIQVALGTRICLSHTPTADEWGELYAMAKKQSLLRWCAKITDTEARTARDAIPDLDGYGCEDSAAE